jgi:hypothetical protein
MTSCDKLTIPASSQKLEQGAESEELIGYMPN